MIRLNSALVFVSISLAACAGGPKADWRGFADCAAAYKANAAFAEPDRAASMTAMVSEVADAYEASAVDKIRSLSDMSQEAALSTVRSQVNLKLQEFSGRSREQVERFIESCPQPDE